MSRLAIPALDDVPEESRPTRAAVSFAATIARDRGHVGDADVAAVRGAGFSGAEIVEIVVVTAENMFTNLLNVVAQTDIDFPVVRAVDAA